MNTTRLILSDYDRTFTDASLKIEPGLRQAIGRLQKNGVFFGIVSGRKCEFMDDFFTDNAGLIDAYVAENGCVGYACGKKYYLCSVTGQEALLTGLKRSNIPYDAGDVVVSVDRKYGALLDTLLISYPELHAVKNIDSIMILPAGVSKASGIQWLLGMYRLTPEETACIGDAENDLEMRDLCSLLGAVGNALPELKRASDYVCGQEFGLGLQEFIEYVERQNAGNFDL